MMEPFSQRIDPVCGMTVDTAAGKPSLHHEGATFYFYSQGCHDKFSVDPEFYLSGAHKKKAKVAPEGTLYTCPMHPEIIEDHPAETDLMPWYADMGEDGVTAFWKRRAPPV